LFNALIFYFIAVTVFNGKPGSKIVAFLLAIGFVLNPLTIESVAWISGRTDILATFFSLLVFLFYFSKLKYKIIIVPIFFLLGLLAKENTLCVFIIIPLCEIGFYYRSKGFKYSIFRALTWTAILSIPLFVYLYLRFAGFGLFQMPEQIQPVLVQGMHIQEGVSIKSQIISNLFTLPAVIAFYLKKFIFPFPLNFAISQINVVMYSTVFVFMGIISTVLVLKKKFYYPFWILLLIISFFPALPVALSDIAWTRFAERYLYLSIPVICLFAGDLYYQNRMRYPEKVRIIKIIAFAILIVFSFGSIQRINVWKNKESLWEDTYKKNPTHGKVLYKYGSALGVQKGLPYFKLAVEHAIDNEWRDFSLLAMAKYASEGKEYKTAVGYVRQAIKINPNRRNLNQAAGIIRKIMNEDKTDDIANRQFLIQIYQKAYAKQPKPVDLYNLINIYKYAGDKLNETKYYQILQDRFPNSRAARNLFKKYNLQ